MLPLFDQGYADAMAGDPPASDDPEYLRGWFSAEQTFRESLPAPLE